MDLGYKPETPSAAVTAPAAPEVKTCYPSFSISGEPAKELAKELKLKPGTKTKVRAVVELELTGWHDDQWDNRLCFDVLSLEAKGKAFEDRSPDEQFDQLRREAEDSQQGDDSKPNSTSYGRG
ncbi:MAG: hypothetical protein KGL39_21280 [Patescibacteria group bacterium]|nr:hypothetical protein [Patescibacteria group bacterium]